VFIRSGVHKRIFIHSQKNKKLQSASAYYKQLTVKELQVSAHTYNQCVDIAKEMYLNILKQGYNERNDFAIRRYVNSRTNNKYFISLTNYILYWKISSQGRNRFTDFKSVAKDYFDKSFLNASHSFYFHKNRPLPNQVLTDRSIMEWESYWDKYNDQHGNNIRENSMFKNPKSADSKKEKACKKEFGFKSSIECHNYWVHKINSSKRKLKLSELMFKIQDWEADWDKDELDKIRRLKLKLSKENTSFNKLMRIQVKNLYNKFGDVKLITEKFKHLLPETIGHYIKN
tara:strand:- start:5337 stop:6194 length:858 start_codon:yes stop_codon:yes gene_type:complete